jgi:Na+/melibiose symporter-like transporter
MALDEPLTRSQQNYRVALLGFIFMLMFTAFNSLQNTVSVIYNKPGFESLGKVSLLFLYFVFGVCTFFTPFIIRKFGYNLVFLISALGYALYSLAGLIMVLWENISVGLGWFLVLFGAAACGASASAIWVAQGSYVSTVAG